MNSNITYYINHSSYTYLGLPSFDFYLSICLVCTKILPCYLHSMKFYISLIFLFSLSFCTSLIAYSSMNFIKSDMSYRKCPLNFRVKIKWHYGYALSFFSKITWISDLNDWVLKILIGDNFSPPSKMKHKITKLPETTNPYKILLTLQYSAINHETYQYEQD
jgi:hypothetical protein